MAKNISTEKFDAIIIGSGQAGKPLAVALGNEGYKTAVIESKYVGGTCINYGCTPTKTMIASAKIAELARNAGKYGIMTGKVKADMYKIMERKNEIVKSFRNNERKQLQKHSKIELIFGEGSFIKEYVVEIKMKSGGERILTAEKIFINTGTSPFIPNIEGLKKTGYLTSASILNIESLPPHLIILGGSYVGLEFGQMFRRFGSEVTIIQNTSRLAAREDEDISEEIRKIFTQEGINFLLKSEIKRAVKNKHGKLVLSVKSGTDMIEIEGSHLLVAAGVKPNTENLNSDSAGIKTNISGYIKVNHKLETNKEGIYALGDVKDGPAFTHISYDDYRIVKGNLLENKNLSTRERLVPYTLFTDPQLGRVGLNETQAKERRIKYKTVKIYMDSVARAVETGETCGFMKAVIDADSGQILGCSILGSQGGEIMSMIEIAMMAKMPYTALRDAVFAHPLFSESLNNLFASV